MNTPMTNEHRDLDHHLPTAVAQRNRRVAVIAGGLRLQSSHPDTSTHTAHAARPGSEPRGSVLSVAEKIGIDLLNLIKWFRRNDSLQPGALDAMGLSVDERTLVNLGWLIRSKGPGRWDEEKLVPSGKLLTFVVRSRGHVENVWANHRESAAVPSSICPLPSSICPLP